MSDDMTKTIIQPPSEFRLIVAGGRDFNAHKLLANKLIKITSEDLKDYIVSIVSGMARGADMMAYDFAIQHQVAIYEFPANWDKFGKSAGYRRNAEMANFSQGLLAFWDGKSHGTKHMIDAARSKKLLVKIVKY